jgi:hypothetical protein
MVSRENITACTGDRVPLWVDVVEFQGDDGERNNYRKISRCAFEVIGLLVVADAAHQQAEPYHAIEYDHQHRIHGVACQRGFVGGTKHHR